MYFVIHTKYCVSIIRRLLKLLKEIIACFFLLNTPCGQNAESLSVKARGTQ
jgi:hypothetical protein